MWRKGDIGDLSRTSIVILLRISDLKKRKKKKKETGRTHFYASVFRNEGFHEN